MEEQKTKQTDASVPEFLNSVEDETKRKDCFTIAAIMKEITGLEPKMWGTAIIGFGSYHYKYQSGHEGNSCLIGFSPRKQNITLYLMLGYNNFDELLEKLGKHKTGKGCLYINKLDDVDINILKKIIKSCADSLMKKYQ